MSPVSLRTIHLVRHGQSTWNLEGRLQGQTMEVPLTEVDGGDLSPESLPATAERLAAALHAARR